MKDTSTPERKWTSEQRKFVSLIVLGAVVIVLLWVATWPLNYNTDNTTPLGVVAGRLSGELDSVGELGDYFNDIKDATTQQ